jgi:hypothetical protein
MITGTHDIDLNWVKEVRAVNTLKGPVPLIVPRIVYERQRLSQEDIPFIVDKIVDILDTNQFDGIVFEVLGIVSQSLEAI